MEWAGVDCGLNILGTWEESGVWANAGDTDKNQPDMIPRMESRIFM